MRDRSGLYRHYKNGQLYRFLFVCHMSLSATPRDDEPLKVFSQDDFLFLGKPGECSTCLFEARWSGNPRVVLTGPSDEDYGSRLFPIAIYVAIYDNGRIAARPLAEFEEQVEHAGKKVPRFAKVAETPV